MSALDIERAYTDVEAFFVQYAQRHFKTVDKKLLEKAIDFSKNIGRIYALPGTEFFEDIKHFIKKSIKDKWICSLGEFNFLAVFLAKAYEYAAIALIHFKGYSAEEAAYFAQKSYYASAVTLKYDATLYDVCRDDLILPVLFLKQLRFGGRPKNANLYDAIAKLVEHESSTVLHYDLTKTHYEMLHSQLRDY
ncbi:hypothetical protein HYU18_04195 [Candidatus Woesearchaeota archaeon]|nr:hypothetical protein [Candidatus Woesearchaeota archaeon]